MKTRLADEQGVSLVELLGAIVIFSTFVAIFSSTLYIIIQASVRQGRIAAFQGMANEIVAQVQQIAKIDGIYEYAGYLGKYDSLLFHEEHIVKVMPEGAISAGITDEGSPRMIVTDIADTSNIRGRLYDTKDHEIKLKIIQQKNENEATLTQHYTPNYRDTFSIQSKVLILFYKETIHFQDYYDDTTGWWQLEDLLDDHQEQTVYQREFTVTYRDDEKARGGVPGNGRW